jgi:hypothetical protein
MAMYRRSCFVALLLLLIGAPAQPSSGVEQKTPSGARDSSEIRGQMIFGVYPEHGDVLIASPFLARPTASSVTVSVMALAGIDAYVEYGRSPAHYTHSTEPVIGQAQMDPLAIMVSGLEPNSAYWYRLRYRLNGEDTYTVGPAGRFRTQRTPGSTFTYTIQADSHIIPVAARGDSAGLMLYELTIANVLLDGPDFHIDMGDFAHTEFYGGATVKSLQQALERYLFQRFLLSRTAHSVPFYLVIGNHEGEQGWRRKNRGDSLEVWGTLARKRIIPNPYPDGFYSGNRDMTSCCGLREDYYAWEWGDALFVVLDPFWYTEAKPHMGGGYYLCTADGWDWTLGRDQYEWLYQTLHECHTEWKFVFTHHLTGGLVRGKRGPSVYGRGGIDAASYSVAGHPTFEWGGEDSTGRDVFDEKRPGWEHGPIHGMLVEEGVDIVFRGHDHAFVFEELDGIVYQTCPQPADSRYGSGVSDREIFSTGISSNNSGYVRVTVSPDSVRVDYVRSVLPEDEPLMEDGEPISNRTVSYSYTLNK